jgi:hypothetical protein
MQRTGGPCLHAPTVTVILTGSHQDLIRPSSSLSPVHLSKTAWLFPGPRGRIREATLLCMGPAGDPEGVIFVQGSL